MKVIALTGASGFVGGHTLREFATAGYRIRAIVRSNDAFRRVRELHQSYEDSFEIAIAGLSDEQECIQAIAGCDGLVHMASPLPGSVDNAKMIESAVRCTETVLNAATAVGVARVVITSSLGAVCGSELKPNGALYGEEDWTSANDPNASIYNRSKVIAEKRALEIARSNEALALIRVNPGVAIGPVLDGSVNVSNRAIYDIAYGKMSFLPPVSYEYVDVRDVARVHRVAFEKATAGQRLLCSTEFLSFSELASMILDATEELGIDPANVTSTDMGDQVPQELEGYRSDFGVRRPIARKRLWRKFGMTPIGLKTSVLDALRTMRPSCLETREQSVNNSGTTSEARSGSRP